MWLSKRENKCLSKNCWSILAATAVPLFVPTPFCGIGLDVSGKTIPAWAAPTITLHGCSALSTQYSVPARCPGDHCRQVIIVWHSSLHRQRDDQVSCRHRQLTCGSFLGAVSGSTA